MKHTDNHTPLGGGHELNYDSETGRYSLVHIDITGRSCTECDNSDDSVWKDRDRALDAARNFLQTLPVPDETATVALALAAQEKESIGQSDLVSHLTARTAEEPSLLLPFFHQQHGHTDIRPLPWQTDELMHWLRLMYRNTYVCRKTGTIARKEDLIPVDDDGSPAFMCRRFPDRFSYCRCNYGSGPRLTGECDGDCTLLVRLSECAQDERTLTPADGEAFLDACRRLGLDARQNAVEAVHTGHAQLPTGQEYDYCYSLDCEWDRTILEIAAENIRKEMKVSGLTVQEAARKAGLPVETVAGAAEGTTDLTLTQLAVLADALETSWNSLL